MSTYKLIGLNKKTTTGVYGTIEKPVEDWFHADFDSTIFPVDRQNELFDFFKNSEENYWHNKNHQVEVSFEGKEPVVTKLILDDVPFKI